MNRDYEFLQLAYEQAKLSLDNGGFPAGAIIVKNDEIISKGTSLGYKQNDPTGHAETDAIRKACKDLQTVNLEGATLYASMQPCLMCFSAASWANISRIVYGYKKTSELANKGYYEGITDISKINKQNNRKLEIVFVPYNEDGVTKLLNEYEVAL